MKKLILIILKSSTIAAGFFLLLSVLWSAIWLIIDNDEFSHVHLTYWIANGFLPYRDFYASVYTPIFHLFLLPIFSLAGFQLESFPLMRLVMVCVFILRLILFFVLTKTVLGSRIGIISILLYLLDPFTTFSAMQIRPDNLMLVLWLCGMVALLRNYEKSKDRYAVIAGIFAGVSILTMAKIAPSMLALGLGLFISKGKKAKRVLLHWIIGVMLVGFLTLLLLFSFDLIPQFMTQAITNSRTFYSSHLNPVPLGFFYKPNNNLIYGYAGKPLTWIYVWVLSIFAVGGWLLLLVTRFRDNHVNKYDGIVLSLLAMLPLQWIPLIMLRSIFIQYYIPLTYLYAIFAAVLVNKIFSKFTSLWYILFILMTIVSIKGSLLRVTYYGNTNQIDSLKRLYGNIPQDAKVFPVGLFRPMTYPLLYGLFWGDIPSSIQMQFPDMLPVLAQTDVAYVLVNGYEIQYYPPDVRKYILIHFRKIQGNKNLWARIQ